MSFGGGGAGGGTIRYALVVEDQQASQKLNTFKTNLTGLATPTATLNKNLAQMGTQLKTTSTSVTQMGTSLKTTGAGIGQTTTLINQHTTAQQKLNTVTVTTGKNVATMGSQFKASVTQIKNAGPPLANFEKTSTSLGTTIKNNASKFSGLATGMSATASGALQLAAGFRDYNDAQIAVDRVTRRLSLGQEALGKAQAKLNELNKSGSASSADLAQAQLDVTQAQKQVEIQTQLVGEAQERMFDSQTQFAVSVIPTVLGAVGTLGSAFKDFGGSLGKLTGAFKQGGAAAKLFSSDLGLIGIAATASVAVALLVIDTVQKARDKWKQLGVEFTEGSIFDTKKMAVGAQEWDEIVKRTSASTADWAFNQETVLKKFKEMGGMLDENGRIIITFTDRNIKLGDSFKKNGETAATWIGWMRNYRELGESNADVMARLTKAGFDNATATKIAAAANEDYNLKVKLGIPIINASAKELIAQTKAFKEQNAVIDRGISFRLRQSVEEVKPALAGVVELMKETNTETGRLHQQFLAFPQVPAIDNVAKQYKTVTTNADGTTKSINELYDAFKKGDLPARNLGESFHKIQTFGATAKTSVKDLSEEVRASLNDWQELSAQVGKTINDVIAASGGSTEVIIENRRKAQDIADKAAEAERKTYTDLADKIIAESGGSTEVIIENQRRAAEAADQAAQETLDAWIESAKKSMEAWQDWKKTREEESTEALKSFFKIENKPEKFLDEFFDSLPNKMEKKVKLGIKAEVAAEDVKAGIRTLRDKFMRPVIEAGTGKTKFKFRMDMDDKQADEIGEGWIKAINKQFGKGGPAKGSEFDKLQDEIENAIEGSDSASAIEKLMSKPEIQDLLEENPIPVVATIAPESIEDMRTFLGKEEMEVPATVKFTTPEQNKSIWQKSAATMKLFEMSATAKIDNVVIGNGVDPGQTAFDANPYGATIDTIQFSPKMGMNPAEGAAAGEAIRGVIQQAISSGNLDKARDAIWDFLMMGPQKRAQAGLTSNKTGGANWLAGQQMGPGRNVTGGANWLAGQQMGGGKGATAQLDISAATKNITRLMGNYMGYIKLVNTNVPIARLNIVAATKNITRLIGNFNGYVATANSSVPIARLNIVAATKNITRLIGNFNGWVLTVKKANPVVKLNADAAFKTINRLVGNLNGIPNITRTVTIKAQGSGLRYAQSGMHETLGMDTMIMAHKGERVDIGHQGGSSGGGGGGTGNIVVNLTNVLADKEITRTFRRELGKDIYRFGPT